MSQADPIVSVGASDSLIIAISLTGFAVLTTTFYFVLIRPSTNNGSATDAKKDGGAVPTYEQLKQARVADLNRARRRARARAIAKEETKDLAGSFNGTSSSSKQERQRVLRDIELRERRAEQGERDRIQQGQLQRAALAKKQRDARKQHERTAQTRAELERWETFLGPDVVDETSRTTSLTVVELIERLQRDRILDIKELSLEYRVKQELIVRRLNELVDDGRIAGVFAQPNDHHNNNSRTRFVYFSDHELRSIAMMIESKQNVSYDELAAYCTGEILRPVSTSDCTT